MKVLTGFSCCDSHRDIQYTIKIMSFFAKQNFHGLAVFIWLVSILTLSISNEIKTDGNVLLTSTLNTSFIGGSSKTEQPSPIEVQSTSEPIHSTKVLYKNVATPSVAGEGGPIPIISPTEQASSTASHLIKIFNNTDTHSNLSKEEENIPYVKRKKYTSKIVSRKGANEMLNVKNENAFPTDVTLSYNSKAIAEFSTTAIPLHNNDTSVNISKSNTTKQFVNSVSNTNVNNSLHSVLRETLTTNVPVTASTIQEHKPKPTATVIEPNSDKQEYIPHVKGPRLGMPKKIDYVLPVIVTLIALPVLGAIIFMVYKQVRDYWDKRHYRRMDFLIDGMYND